jgi:hypothetical protein
MFRISARQLTPAATRLLGIDGIPVIEQLRQGAWKGSIAYEKNGESMGNWSGQFDLQNAVFEIPGLASPVRLTSAGVQMGSGGIQVSRMRGRAGSIKFEGDYRYDESAVHPHRLRLTMADLQVADIEPLLLPSLRRNEGFLARAFRREQPIPAWLQQRDADISLKVTNLLNGDAALGDLTAHGVWRGAAITVSAVDWQLGDMHANGAMSLNLAKAEPAYKLTGTVENFDYRNGQLDLDGDLETKGTGLDLIANLRSKGTFDGRDIMLAPDAEVREVSGAYHVAVSSGIPKLLLSNVQVLQGGDTLIGQGASQPDGHIVLELASGRKQVRLTGMLLPLHPDPARQPAEPRP